MAQPSKAIGHAGGHAGNNTAVPPPPTRFADANRSIQQKAAAGVAARGAAPHRVGWPDHLGPAGHQSQISSHRGFTQAPSNAAAPSARPAVDPSSVVQLTKRRINRHSANQNTQTSASSTPQSTTKKRKFHKPLSTASSSQQSGQTQLTIPTQNLNQNQQINQNSASSTPQSTTKKRKFHKPLSIASSSQQSGQTQLNIPTQNLNQNQQINQNLTPNLSNGISTDKVYVTVVEGRVHFDHDRTRLPVSNNGPVEMTVDQFIRFKNAGKQHASGGQKIIGGKSRYRSDRTEDDSAKKWDVTEYAHAQKQIGPWGRRHLTNRDHMNADSSNQKKDVDWVDGLSASEIKKQGLVIFVSGEHHREDSYTYGGRTKKKDTPNGSTRTEYGTDHPEKSLAIEIDSMLLEKSKRKKVRIEMVGGYRYLIKLAYQMQRIEPKKKHWDEFDRIIMNYLEDAVKNDDGKAR
ncbi:hypothetical protein [Azospirillum soli]|uniref:hypothetical protein n=1 Tax=Azospirillum soli TaxID=1304799 RepID=UPI001AE2998E|nr:hypothetical protein [Azospirillum soli]MBP2312810.1 hypothetical protein [Azospirillum soli]